jgi:hypothetical protein
MRMLCGISKSPLPHDRKSSVAVKNKDWVGIFTTLYFVNRSFAVNSYPGDGSSFPSGFKRLRGESNAFEGQYRRCFDPSTELRRGLFRTLAARLHCLYC